MPSYYWCPCQTYLQTLAFNFRNNFTQIVYMSKVNLNFAFVFNGVVIGITYLNVINPLLSCSGEVVFTLIIYHIHQRLNIIDFLSFLWIHLNVLCSRCFFGRFIEHFLLVFLGILDWFNLFGLMNFVSEMNFKEFSVFDYCIPIRTDSQLINISSLGVKNVFVCT